MKIAINGMGRIGRLLFRRLVHHPQLEIVAVNDVMDVENLVYLIKYDSVYGSWQQSFQTDDQYLQFEDRSVRMLNEKDAKNLPWRSLDVDVVLECSGRYSSYNAAMQHIEAGAKRVLLSTTGGDDIPLGVFGWNDSDLLASETKILSPGGCMTNCTTHFIELFKNEIEAAHIHVIHSYTSRQELVDTSAKDFRRGRAAAASIIPVTVDLADSLQTLFPHLQHKIAAVTTRVPVDNGAYADFSFHLKNQVSKAEINSRIQELSEGKLKGIIAYTEDGIVSTDVRGNTHSAVVDGSLTSSIGHQIKFFAFFDNEYGFTSRMIDWLMRVKASIS